MANYVDIKKMYDDFIKKATLNLKEVVPPIMTEVHKEAIVIEVYESYEPTLYNGTLDFVDRRYGDNGLLDEHNFEYQFDINKNSMTVTLYNKTKGNQYAPNNQRYTYIDSIIVTGDGYSWKNSGVNGVPRDFYKATEEILAKPEIRNKIIKELNKRGFKVW